jgi:hypothetical protein
MKIYLFSVKTFVFFFFLCSSESESESYVTTNGQSASLSWYKAPIRGLRPDFFSVRNTEYVWQLHFWFRGSPSLTRGRVCLLYVPLALSSAVFLGPSPLGLVTVFYCLRFETFIFVASYLSCIFLYNLESDPQKTCHCLHCWRLYLATAVYLAVAWHWLVPSALFTATRFLPSNRCLPGSCLAFAKHVWLVPTSYAYFVCVFFFIISCSMMDTVV